MVLLPIKPIVIKSSRPARETVKLCLRRSFLFLSFACVLVVCVFGIDNLAFVDERKAGEKNDDAFDLRKNEKKDNDRGRRRPGFGLIDSVLRASTATTTKEEIMHEVEEMKYGRPSDESSEDSGGAFGDIEEEEEEEGKEEDESAKEIDTPSTTTTMDEVKEKEEEKPTDVATKEVEIKEEEQREQPAAASSVEREETKGEAPREEGDEREQRIAEDDLTTPKSFVEFTAKDLEDVERFDYMMQKRDGSIGLSKNQCQEVKTYFQETLKPRYEDLKTNRIVIIDWSENYQNGIGDEMQHYQELFIIGVSTGRAAYVKTQKAECDGLGVSEGDEIENSKTYEDLARKCQFDLGDYFIGYGDVDWKWDKGKRRRAKKELFEEGDFEETVFTWSQKGAYIGDEQPERV